MTARDGKRRDAGFTRRLVLATTLQGAALAALGFRLYSLRCRVGMTSSPTALTRAR